MPRCLSPICTAFAVPGASSTASSPVDIEFMEARAVFFFHDALLERFVALQRILDAPASSNRHRLVVVFQPRALELLGREGHHVPARVETNRGNCAPRPLGLVGGGTALGTALGTGLRGDGVVDGHGRGGRSVGDTCRRDGPCLLSLGLDSLVVQKWVYAPQDGVESSGCAEAYRLDGKLLAWRAGRGGELGQAFLECVERLAAGDQAAV